MADYKESYHRYRKYYRHLQALYQRPPVKDFTFLILSLLTTAFFAFFAIKPSLKTIGELVKEIKDKRMASETLEEKIKALSLAQQEYALIQPDLPKVYSVLPQKSNFSHLAKQIEYLSGKNKIFLLSLSFEKTSLFGEEKKDLVPLDFSLEIGGEYQNLKGFLGELENLDRMVVIKDFSFSKKKMDREKTEFPLSLTGDAEGYYLP